MHSYTQTMEKLYNQVDFKELKHKKDVFKIAFIVLICLFVISISILVILSTYQTRDLYSSLCSIVGTIEVFFIIFFIGKFNFYRLLHNEYAYLFHQEKKEYKLVFDDISIKPITLQDKSRVYEVHFKNGEGIKILYLSYLFSNDIFIKNHHYKIETAFDYVVGYEDED